MAITVNIDTPERISKSFTQVAHGFAVGNPVYRRNDNIWFKARSTTSSAGRSIGFVTAVADADNFTLTFQGYITTGVPTATAGTVYYVDPITAGTITATPDLNHTIPVLVVIESGSSAILMLGIDGQRIKQWLMGDVSATLTSGTTRYVYLWGSAGTPQATESLRQNVGMMGTYSLLTINTVAVQPASGSIVLTVRKNSSDESIAITVAAGSAAGVYDDLVNVVTSSAPNDLLCIRVVNNATATSTNIISTRILYNSH